MIDKETREKLKSVNLVAFAENNGFHKKNPRYNGKYIKLIHNTSKQKIMVWNSPKGYMWDDFNDKPRDITQFYWDFIQARATLKEVAEYCLNTKFEDTANNEYSQVDVTSSAPLPQEVKERLSPFTKDDNAKKYFYDRHLAHTSQNALFSPQIKSVWGYALFDDSKKYMQNQKFVAYPLVDKHDNTVALSLRNPKNRAMKFTVGQRSSSMWRAYQGTPTHMIVVEAPEKALAHYALHKGIMAEKQVNPMYVSCQGAVSDKQIELFDIWAKRFNIPREKQIISLDNDHAGSKYTNRILTHLADAESNIIPQEKQIDKPIELSEKNREFIKYAQEKFSQFGVTMEGATIANNHRNLSRLNVITNEFYHNGKIKGQKSTHKDWNDDLEVKAKEIMNKQQVSSQKRLANG